MTLCSSGYIFRFFDDFMQLWVYFSFFLMTLCSSGYIFLFFNDFMQLWVYMTEENSVNSVRMSKNIDA